MKHLKKSKNKDFLILNLTDPHLYNCALGDHPNPAILKYTISTLMERVHPDLITISGDIGWAGLAGGDAAHRYFADFIDEFGVPWAPVWGNHDQPAGMEYLNADSDL